MLCIHCGGGGLERKWLKRFVAEETSREALAQEEEEKEVEDAIENKKWLNLKVILVAASK